MGGFYMIQIRRMALLLLCAMMFSVLTSCTLTASPENTNSVAGTLLQEATAWFETQTTRYEMISGEVVDDRVVFLTGTKNPGTDVYQFFQAFVVEQTEDAFTVSAWRDGECGISAGFSVHVLAAEDLTVVFGDTTDSIFDFINDQRIDVAFTKARLIFSDGGNETKALTGDAPYLLIIDGTKSINDVEFFSGELAVRYSDFYSENLMEKSATLDTTNLFEPG